MQDYKARKEIEDYGEIFDDEEDFEYETDDPQQRKYSIIPIIQTACCALILISLICLKYLKPKEFEEAIAWYKEASVQEVELPKFIQQAAKDSGESSSASGYIDETFGGESGVSSDISIPEKPDLAVREKV